MPKDYPRHFKKQLVALVVDFIHYCDFLRGYLGGFVLLAMFKIDVDRLIQLVDCGDFTYSKGFGYIELKSFSRLKLTFVSRQGPIFILFKILESLSSSSNSKGSDKSI